LGSGLSDPIGKMVRWMDGGGLEEAKMNRKTKDALGRSKGRMQR